MKASGVNKVYHALMARVRVGEEVFIKRGELAREAGLSIRSVARALVIIRKRKPWLSWEGRGRAGLAVVFNPVAISPRKCAIPLIPPKGIVVRPPSEGQLAERRKASFTSEALREKRALMADIRWWSYTSVQASRAREAGVDLVKVFGVLLWRDGVEEGVIRGMIERMSSSVFWWDWERGAMGRVRFLRVLQALRKVAGVRRARARTGALARSHNAQARPHTLRGSASHCATTHDVPPLAGGGFCSPPRRQSFTPLARAVSEDSWKEASDTAHPLMKTSAPAPGGEGRVTQLTYELNHSGIETKLPTLAPKLN